MRKRKLNQISCKIPGLWYVRPKKNSEDEVDLVHNMEIPQQTTAIPPRISNNEEMNVHYVVPRPETTQGTQEELSVYISTPNGLKKLERKNSDR